MVVVVKRDRGSKKDNARKATDDPRDETVYVYASKGAVFLVTGEPKESKYSYGVPIIPLYGKYRAKDGKVYDAEELRGKRVVLNLRKDDPLLKALRKGVKLVALGFDEDEIAVVEDGGEDG